jgi:hypothetical protein
MAFKRALERVWPRNAFDSPDIADVTRETAEVKLSIPDSLSSQSYWQKELISSRSKAVVDTTYVHDTLEAVDFDVTHHIGFTD